MITKINLDTSSSGYMNDKLLEVLLNMMKLFIQNNKNASNENAKVQNGQEIVMVMCNQNLQRSRETNKSIRVYLNDEQLLLNAECRGYLYQLEQTGLISPVVREIIIHNLMSTSNLEIDLPLLKIMIKRIVENINDTDITGIIEKDWFDTEQALLVVH